ncbi:hypothetical protein Tamer19_38210 [Cupriavidus sp. TA19]|nr:hypothetical protein Tamer19_38210 [Cupriavidus sp. TA19]
MHSVQIRTANRQHAKHVAAARACAQHRGLAALQVSVAQQFHLPAVLLLAVRGIRD